MTEFELEFLEEVRGIRKALETLVNPPAEPDAACAHPLETRRMLSGMGEADEFICGTCGAHCVAEAVPSV